MIAKLNNDGAFHTWKWSGVERPDVGSSANVRNERGHAGGFGGVGAWGRSAPVENQLPGLPASCPWVDLLGLPSIKAKT